MKNRFLKVTVLIVLFAIVASTLEAQCPMCRIGVESNLKNGGSAGSGLNAGILYMLAMPYLLVATFGFLWYRNRKKGNDQIGFDDKKSNLNQVLD